MLTSAEQDASLPTYQATADVVIVGAGASGLLAAIAAARHGCRVVICEKQPKAGMKILASGGERCNLTNTLDRDTYMTHFGRQGRFMSMALDQLSNRSLVALLSELGVPTKSKDGFRVFPATHKSQTVLDGLLAELARLKVGLCLDTPVTAIRPLGSQWQVETAQGTYNCRRVIVSTGGLTAPRLGTTGDGYKFAKELGHRVQPTFPGGVPLRLAEDWGRACTADTLGKAQLVLGLKKHRLVMTGDVIFTRYGLTGKLAMDFSRHVTPLLETLGKVPIGLKMRPKLNRQLWQDILTAAIKGEGKSVAQALCAQLPESVARELPRWLGLDPDEPLRAISPRLVDSLAQTLTETPLTVTGTLGYKVAFITRGGVSLKELDPNSLESRINPGLYFCGEVVDLDGPCGGYNMQWAFASGYLAGLNAARQSGNPVVQRDATF